MIFEPLRFEVPGEPCGLARHRTRVVAGARHRPFAQMYDPAENQNRKGLIQFHALRAFNAAPWCGVPWDVPLRVIVKAYMYRPASKRVKHPERLPIERRLNLARPRRKPDWDNIGKLVCDALNGVVWTDDAIICDATVRKLWVAESPRLVIDVAPIKEFE